MSGNLNEGQLVTYAIDEMVEIFSGQHTLTDMSQNYDPGSESLQRSANQYWKPEQQQSRTQDGWDISGQQDGVLELSIQGSLNDPTNVYRKLRADDVRDETAYRRAVRADAMRLKGQMEFRGLEKARTHGAFCITNPNAFGAGSFDIWDGLASCTERAITTEFYREDGACAFLNPAAYKAGGKDLVTSTARFKNNIPDDAYNTGYIDNKVAGFTDVVQHSKLGQMVAQTAVVTVPAAQSFAPQASELSPNGSPVPFDNRYATIPVDDTTGVRIGDKFVFDNAGTTIKAVSLDEKIPQTYAKTFTVVQVVNGTTLTISPRPIALDDVALSPLQRAYANVDTTIAAGATLSWQNIVTRQSNIIMQKDALVLASSPIPLNHELFKDLNAQSFSVGPINGVIGFEGDLGTLEGSYRIALWYEWNVEKPDQVGVLLDGQT